MRRFLLAGILLINTYAYSTDITPYIVNGSDADINEYPNFASLYYEGSNVNNPVNYCGATIINNDYILTAAHCLVGDQANLHLVRVAPRLDVQANYQSNTYPRAAAVYFPSTYIDSSAELWPDDIAIIRLESPLTVGDLYGLLNFGQNGQSISGGTIKAIGHGYTAQNVEGDGNLLETELFLVSNADCKRR